MLINSTSPHPSGHTSDIWLHVFSLPEESLGNLMQRSCVYHSVSCTIILLVVYYPVSCVSLDHLCNLSVSCMLQVAVGSCASLGQLCVSLPVLCHLVGCMITLSVMVTRSVVYFSISCALLSQLCTSLSVEHYSVSCVLLSQFSQTRSVVLHSVSWMIIPSVVYYSVNCVLFHHLCITPSGEFKLPPAAGYSID